MSPAGPGTVEDVFCQNFTAGVPGIGETLTVPLKDDGEEAMVTEDNRREFVDLYVDYYLNNAIHKQVCIPPAPAVTRCNLVSSKACWRYSLRQSLAQARILLEQNSWCDLFV